MATRQSKFALDRDVTPIVTANRRSAASIPYGTACLNTSTPSSKEAIKKIIGMITNGEM